MPQGAGNDPLTSPRQGQKKVFIGKGKIEIPALENNGSSRSIFKARPPSNRDSPPSPCSSRAPSRFSPTYNKTMITTQHSSNVSNQTLSATRHSAREKYAIDGARPPNDHQYSNLQSGVVGYLGKPTERDFVSPPAKEETTHLPGPTLNPSDTRLVHKRGSLNGKIRNFGGAPLRCGHRGSMGSIPSTFVPVKPSEEDFVRNTRNHTPPPDFIERDSMAQGVQTISSQPDLSAMLSGAVTKSALLKRRRDFVPTAVMPASQLRAKSKSLSDLSKQQDKTRRYLDRRKVIQMDPNDDECCSHTEVAPSSMMTLAMELLVARENKAAALFNEAKKKTNDVATDHDSILPKLWVVPKAPSPDSAATTASHLKPVLKTETIDGNDKKTSGLRNSPSPKVSREQHQPCEFHTESNPEEEKTSVESHAAVVMRKKKPKSSYLTRCVALSEQKVEDQHDSGNSQCTEEPIRPEDVERDLKTLTVADLVGSPDTVFTDTESEMEHTQPVYSNPIEAIKSKTKRQWQCGITAGKGSPMAAPEHSITSSDAHKSETDIEVRCNFEKRPEKEDSTHPFDSENTCPSTILETNVPIKLECGRRSSSVSASSSLTTVSSLSLSSNSMASLDLCGGRDGFKLFTPPCQDTGDDYVTSVTNNSPALGSPLKQDYEVEEETIPVAVCDQQTISGTAPHPPRRSKSLGVIDKIRSSRFAKERAAKEKWTEYRDAVKLTDSGRDFKIFRQAADSSVGDYCTRKSSPKNPTVMTRGQSLQNTTGDKTAKHANIQNSKHVHPVDVKRDCHQRSPILIARDVPESLCGRSQDDTQGKSKRVPASNEILHEGGCIGVRGNFNEDQKGQIPSQKSYREAEGWLTSLEPAVCRESGPSLPGMNTARFRNGEISVIGGSRVTLARNSNQVDHSSNISGNNQPAAGIYLSDIISLKDKPDQKSCCEKPSKNIIAPTSAMTSETAQEAETIPHEQDESDGGSGDLPKLPCEGEVVRPEDKQQFLPAYQSKESTSIRDDLVRIPTSSSDQHPGKVTSLHTRSLHDLGSASAEFGFDHNGTKNEKREGSPSGQAPSRVTLNGVATPYSRDSAIKLLTGRNVYTSRVKISLNPAKSRENENAKQNEATKNIGGVGHSRPKVATGTQQGRDEGGAKKGFVGKPPRRHSFSSKDTEQKIRNVREVEAKEMKVTENIGDVNPDLPAHSTVDEGDFAGVVDGPTKNVKEIRAMFKGPDYADYAKPKSLSKKQPAGQAAKLRSEKTTQNANRNSAEVAQQVIGLFKGALTLDEDATAPSLPTEQKETPTQNEAANSEEPKISIKDKVASFNSGRSPVKDAEINNNSPEEVEVSKNEAKPVQSQSPTKVITNPEPVTEEDAKKTAVKQEKVNAESYDESLDQFYDVLEELTAS